MNTDRCKLLFEAGDLVNAQIVTAPMETGPAPRWVVEFTRRNGARLPLCLKRKNAGAEQVRIFNSLDAAFSACQKIGFRGAKVVAH